MMQTDDRIRNRLHQSVSKLKSYIEEQEYRGYDPYDALKSPLLNNPFIKRIPVVSFLAQQLIKRLPLNLRPVLGIGKGLNPVTLGLCIQGYTSLGKAGILSKNEVVSINSGLIDLLVSLIPVGYRGSCWGYDFPWQSRYFRVEAYQPSIVATGIITNALFQYLKFSDDEKAKNLIVSSAAFVMHDLKRLDNTETGFCFSYTPFDTYPVYNASMKAVRLLVQAWSLSGNEEYLKTARQACSYVMNKQNSDGSWFYSASESGKWIDSYHTGYVLDCADEFSKITNIHDFDSFISHGYRYFETHFSLENGFPAFFHNRKYPIDCTAASQVILTLIHFGNTEKAIQSALFTIENMQSDQGNFYFRKFEKSVRKEPFMRWSDAWMFAALSELLAMTGSKNA
jgi:hypothetical protein